MAELGEDQLSLETLVACRDGSDVDKRVRTGGKAIGAGVVIARTVLVHADAVAEGAQRVGENVVARRGQHEAPVLALVVVGRL